MTAAEVAAGMCALMFLAAAGGKLDTWAEWSRLSEELPGPVVLRSAVRIMVPALEAGIVILSFALPAAGLAAGAVVLTGFAAAVWLLAPRLSGRECNCFGAIAPAAISPRLAARNIALAGLAAAGSYLALLEKPGALSLPAVLLTLLCGAVALMLFQYRSLHGTAQVIHNVEEAR